MRAIFLLYFFFLSSQAFAETTLPEICRSGCATPFGTVLGKTREGIPAYSNCQPHCIVPIPVERDGTFLGIEWQCVEFARRWLYTEFGMVFPSIDFAHEIWGKIDHLVLVKEKKDVPLEAHVNGSATLPQRGDLLLYGRDLAETGHIAIVLRVDTQRHLVYIGEENLKNTRWPGDYARVIPYVKEGRRIWLLDAYFIGWKHPVPRK